MNNSNHSTKANSESQSWMMSSETGGEPFNYMTSRSTASVLPPTSSSSQQQHGRQQQHVIHTFQQNDQELSVSPPAQALDYDSNSPRSNKSNNPNRAVIPSKRAAQNRAAQKAFRQRREQYIKDLETKAKEMEDWQEEMDKLKRENENLQDRVSMMENQIHILTGGDTSKIPKVTIKEKPASEAPPQSSLPAVSPTIINENEEGGPSSAMSNYITSASSVKRSHNESRLRYEDTENSYQEDTTAATTTAFAPVPLRAPNQTGFEPNTTSYHSSDRPAPVTVVSEEMSHTTTENKRRKLECVEQPGPAPPATTMSSSSPPQLQYPSQSNNSFVNNSNIPPPLSSDSNVDTNVLPSPIQHQHPPHQTMPPEGYWHNNVQVMNAPPPMSLGDLDLDFDFDPFFEDEFGPTITSNSDFLPNGGQVLDDLFAMLQTRQRPQIPIVPTDDNNQDFGHMMQQL